MNSYSLVCEAVRKRKTNFRILKKRLNKAEKKFNALAKKHGPEVKEKSKQAADLAIQIKQMRMKLGHGY